jgi:hypothetical protein
MFEYPPMSSSTVMLRLAYWLKSIPWTSFASAGTGSEGFKTASVAPVGAAASLPVDMTLCVESHKVLAAVRCRCRYCRARK